MAETEQWHSRPCSLTVGVGVSYCPFFTFRTMIVERRLEIEDRSHLYVRRADPASAQ